MDQPENNTTDIFDSLKVIFKDANFQVSAVHEADHQPVHTMGLCNSPFMAYQGPSRSIIILNVRHSEKDIVSYKEEFDESLFMELMFNSGVFVSRTIDRDVISSDIVVNYIFHVYDFIQLEKNLSRRAKDIFDKEFTKQLEDTLQD